MINLAENGARCDCGSSALGPQQSSPGALCICASCGCTWRVALVLESVPWATVERELDGNELDQFEWLRCGIPSQLRRDRVAPAIVETDWRRAVFALAVSFALCLVAARVFS